MKFFFTLAFVFPCIVFGKELITWAVIDLPPAMIVSGNDKGQGREDWFLKNFQKKLPQYEHENIEMNVSRIYMEMEKGHSECHILGLKTEERLKKLSISKPFEIIITPSIIMTNELWIALGKPAEYSLKMLADNSKYSGLIMSNRSYTEKLDKVINEAIKKNNLNPKPISSDSIIHMMKLNRIQYTLELPWIIFYNQYSKNSNFVSVKIKEIEPFTFSYVYCPKNAWGEKIVKEINAVTRASINDPLYRKNMEKWLDKRSVEVVRKNYHFLVKENL